MSITGDFQKITDEIAAIETERAALLQENAELRAANQVLSEARDRLTADLLDVERDMRYHRERNIALIEGYRSFRTSLLGTVATSISDMDAKILHAYPKMKRGLRPQEQIVERASAEAEEDEPREPGPQHDDVMNRIGETLRRMAGDEQSRAES